MSGRGYEITETSAEVWAVIRAKHHADLVPFSTFSDPDGTMFGGSGQNGRMETAYGFQGADFPIMEAVTTWDIDRSEPYKRLNEKHRYWLCLPRKSEDD